MPIRAVIFDLDNTLLETDDSARIALEQTLDCLDLGPDALRAAYECYQLTYASEERAAHAGDGPRSAYELRLRAWEAVLALLGLPVERARDFVVRYARERRERYRLYDEVPAVLTEVAAHYPTALLTNGFADVQGEKVDAVALRRWIRHYFVSAEIGAWKPSAEAFTAVLAVLGVPPEAAVMVGDSPTNDIAGAQALGMRAVWVNRRQHPHPNGIRATATVADLRPLPHLLADWDRH